MQKMPVINRTCEFAIRLFLRTSLDGFLLSVYVRVSVCVSVSCVMNIFLIIQNKTTVSRFMLRMACSSSCLDQCSCVLSSSPFLFLSLERRH